MGPSSSTEPVVRAGVWDLDPSEYERHALHQEGSAWVEKNCYVDLWIELLHAAGLEPEAALAFTVALDFDGEQWTFYKPPHVDLLTLYGVQVQEMSVFKPLLDHALFHASRGRLVLTEADAFWLPDTQATDYRKQHVKTTIAIDAIDLGAQRLRYFHNAGYYELSGEDFVQTFRLGQAPDPTYLPLFAELASFTRVKKLPTAELAQASRRLLATWLEQRPLVNPLHGFASHFIDQVPRLKAQGLPAYHAFAFATIRQCGSGFELSAAYLRWLEARLSVSYADAARHLEAISTSCKALILKGARAMVSNKPADFRPIFDEMADHWQAAMSLLEADRSRA
jgi:hypothetical protein